MFFPTFSRSSPFEPAQELIYLVIMIAFMDETIIKKCDYYQALACFAGAARLARLAVGLGFATAALDKEYSGSHDAFNMNTSAGFVPLVEKV